MSTAPFDDLLEPYLQNHQAQARTVIKEAKKLLGLLDAIPEEERDQIRRSADYHVSQHVHQDITMPDDPIRSFSSQLRNVMAMDSGLRKMAADSPEALTATERYFTARSWQTFARFNGTLATLEEALIDHNKPLGGAERFGQDNLDAKGRYDDAIETLGLMSNQGWELQQFIEPRQKDIFTARQKHEQALTVLRNASAEPTVSPEKAREP